MKNPIAKSVLVAMLGMATTGVAHAATIYEGNGLKYSLKGDWQIQMRQKAGLDKDLDVEFDDLELKNSIVYDLDNNLQAFGQLDYSFDGEGNDSSKESAKLEEAYVGLKFDNVAVAIGRQNLAGDEFGVEAALETHTAQDRFEQVADKGDDVIRVDAKFDNLTVITSALVSADSTANGDGEAFDLFVATKLVGVELAGAYQTYEANAAGSEEQSTWGVSAAYSFGSVALAADYSTTDTGAAGDKDVSNLAAKFKLSPTTKAAVGVVKSDEGATDTTEWYANVQYQFPSQKNVSLFAEIADTDEANSDLGYLAGMRIKF